MSYQDAHSTKKEGYGLVPPHDVDVETGIIDAFLMTPEFRDVFAEEAKPEWFYRRENQVVFETLLELYHENKPIDQVWLEIELRQKGKLEDATGYDANFGRTMGIFDEGRAYIACEALRSLAGRRALLNGMSRWSKSAYNEPNVFETLAEVEGDLKEIQDMSFIKDDFLVADLSDTVYDEIRNRKAQDGVTGITTGLADLDRITHGWQKSNLVILAARPAMGKTALMLEFATTAALRGVPVGIYSLEMSKDELVSRMLTQVSGVSGERVRSGMLNGSDLQRLAHARDQLKRMVIPVDDTPGLSISEMTARARRWKREHGVGMIVLDYLQLASGDRKKNDNREQEVSQISRGLKGLAKTLDIPVIALSQLSRAVEQRGGDRRPILSDLRESGSVEQDADMVMFLYRPEYYKITHDANGDSTEGIAEVIIAKQRSGATGTVKSYFNKSTMNFRDLETKQTEPIKSYYHKEIDDDEPAF